MKSKTLASALCGLSLILLVSSSSALAEDRRVQHFSGLINDYSPSSSISGSPWEMHGQWSMDVYPERGTADFSADMTMSGFGKVAATGAVDPTQPLVNPHTHHIKLTNAKIIWNMTGCPTYMTPVPTAGFQLNDTVSLLTGNGQIAPFETNPPSSTLQVCITQEELVFSTRSRIRTLRCGCLEGLLRLSISVRRQSTALCARRRMSRLGVESSNSDKPVHTPCLQRRDMGYLEYGSLGLARFVTFSR